MKLLPYPNGADRVKDESICQFNKQRQKAVKETRKNIGKAKDKISLHKQKKAEKAAEQYHNSPFYEWL